MKDEFYYALIRNNVPGVCFVSIINYKDTKEVVVKIKRGDVKDTLRYKIEGSLRKEEWEYILDNLKNKDYEKDAAN